MKGGKQSGKVIHLSDEAHANLQRLSEQLGKPGSVIVEWLIRDEIALGPASDAYRYFAEWCAEPAFLAPLAPPGDNETIPAKIADEDGARGGSPNKPSEQG